VAENLGVAQLSLDVDLKGLEAGLQKAKQQIERFSVQRIKLDFGSADQQFRRLEASAKVFEAQLRKLSTTPLNLNASGLGKLGADAQKAGADLSAFTRGVINGDRALANNIAGLQQQGAAFRTLAANVKIGTAEFRNFTQAAAQAGQKQLFAGFEEIKSLESLFKLGGSGGQSSFKGTEQLLAFSSKIGSTPAAINLYVQALKQAQSLTSTTDANFAKLTAEISRQRQALEQAAAAAERYGKSLKAPQLALPPGRGPSQFTFAGPTAEDLAAEERNRRRQAKIGSRVDYFSTGGRSTPDAGLLARPNPAAIEAERQLAKERLRTADATLKALAGERKETQSIQKASAKRLSGAVSSGLIGGGFPLLFGQGPGAALGGGIGGVAGGALGGGFGFALSIVGTAVGQAFDEALNKGKTLAAGLDDPISKFEELRQAGLISSKAVEKSVASLIAQGREAEAAAKIQLDLSTSFGDTRGLDDLNSAYDELGRSFSQLSVITAKFVAGPLADFLNKLASSFQVFSARSLFEERLRGASPEVQAEARQRVKQRAAEFSGSGRSLSDVGTEAFSAGLTFLDERLGKTQQVQQAEAAIALATARQNDLRSLSFRQIDAQVQGYERLGLELEKQRIEQQRLQDLSVPKADADAINRKAAQDSYTVQQQLNQLTQDRIATQSLEGAQNRLALAAVRERIAAARQLGSLEEGVARSTLETALNIRASVAEAKRREQDIGAQIDAARLRGGDAGEAEASRLVGEQRVAAEETKLKLIEGANALRDAGVRLRKDLDTAFLNLQRLRTGSGGLNQFLGGQDRARREEDVFKALLPRLRQAQGTFAQLTGVRAPEFSGPTSSVNQTILQFIDAVKAEEQALTNTVDTQRALSDNTAALATITGELRTVMGQLTEKNWAVNVSVAADGSSQAYGDVLNGALAS
jgi:hypothetical protein